MQRRTVVATAVATGLSLVAGAFAYAAIGGASILGFGGEPTRHGASQASAPLNPVIVHQVETIDDVVVVSSAANDAIRAIHASEISTVPTTAESVPATAPAASGSNLASPTFAAPAQLGGPASTPPDPGPAPTSAASTPAPTPASTPTPATTAAPATTGPPAATPTSSEAPVTTSTPTTPSPTTAAPTTAVPTTAAPTTAVPTTAPPSTYPPGVPHDWPADKPIPPMPAGCQKAQLEDNGVWNCESSG